MRRSRLSHTSMNAYKGTQLSHQLQLMTEQLGLTDRILGNYVTV
jgi:hypothetical protein